jgi:predicted  nucleic acid-binding Zn-ribbon protein
LEIKLHEKRSKEAKIKVISKKEVLDEAKTRLDFRKGDLSVKKAELDEIVGETQKEEEALIAKSEKAKAAIDQRLITAYDRLRTNAKNGLAVVGVDRDSCGGCFNKIPPQRQLDIESKRKVIVCEHCGRILVPATIED